MNRMMNKSKESHQGANTETFASALAGSESNTKSGLLISAWLLRIHFLCLIFFLFFNYSWQSALVCISFRRTSQGPDKHVLNEGLPPTPIFRAPTWPHTKLL